MGEDDPIPDELCKHVELGVEMTGGWYFAAHEPPIVVGMFHECIVWCRTHFDSDGQMPWSKYAAMGETEQRALTDGVVDSLQRESK